MTIKETLAFHRTDVLGIAKQHGAKRVRIFGSVARGTANASSDLDLLIELELGRTILDIVAIKQDLEELLKCHVDVVTEASVSPHIMEAVLAEARDI